MTLAPLFAEGVYEAFMKDLVGPLGWLPYENKTFKVDLLSQSSLAGKHAPIFVVGLVWSGTSVLQLLLSMDSATRTPKNWEFRFLSSF